MCKDKNNTWWCEIGNIPQTPDEFEKSIERRFGEDFDKAWNCGVNYVIDFDSKVLENR